MIKGTVSQHSFETGASVVEFLAVAPAMLLLGMGLIQMGLIYHGKTIVNYATFEAARVGAVNHALVEPMKTELGMRLAPLVGGDGTEGNAMTAITRSLAAVAVPGNTRLRLIHPTTEAFDDWGIDSPEAGARGAIPNSHLRHHDPERVAVGPSSLVTLQDANLLKIEVTHGFDLKVPIINKFLAGAMLEIDPENAPFYANGKFPITSVATVRMQSEAWKSAAVTAASQLGRLDDEAELETEASSIAAVAPQAIDSTDSANSSDCAGASHGLSGIASSTLPTSSSLTSCGVQDPVYSGPADELSGSGSQSAQPSTEHSGDCGAG